MLRMNKIITILNAMYEINCKEFETNSITGHDEALEKINRNKNTQERKHMKM